MDDTPSKTAIEQGKLDAEMVMADVQKIIDLAHRDAHRWAERAITAECRLSECLRALSLIERECPREEPQYNRFDDTSHGAMEYDRSHQLWRFGVTIRAAREAKGSR